MQVRFTIADRDGVRALLPRVVDSVEAAVEAPCIGDPEGFEWWSSGERSFGNVMEVATRGGSLARL